MYLYLGRSSWVLFCNNRRQSIDISVIELQDLRQQSALRTEFGWRGVGHVSVSAPWGRDGVAGRGRLKALVPLALLSLIEYRQHRRPCSSSPTSSPSTCPPFILPFMASSSSSSPDLTPAPYPPQTPDSPKYTTFEEVLEDLSRSAHPHTPPPFDAHFLKFS